MRNDPLSRDGPPREQQENGSWPSCFGSARSRLIASAPFERGVKRVDDRKVLSGIIPVIQKGLRWVDAPAAYGPHKTLYNRCRRW